MEEPFVTVIPISNNASTTIKKNRERRDPKKSATFPPDFCDIELSDEQFDM